MFKTKSQYKKFYYSSLPILISQLRRLGVQNNQDLEDLVQETYTQAHQSFSSLRSEKASISWLLTIGRRRFIRHIEAKHQAMIDLPTAVIEQIPSIDHDQETTVFLKQILGEINSIPHPTKRSAILRYYLGGEKVTEIAQELDTKPSTITTWLSRFREQFKDSEDVTYPRWNKLKETY